MDSSERSSMSQPGRQPGGAPTGPLDPEEFATRFQQAARILWTIAAGVLGDPTEAEDVLQDVALMALGKLDQYERDTNFTAWAGTFVRNVALNRARKRQRRATDALAPEAVDELRDAGPARNGRAHPTPVGELPVDARGELRDDQHAFDDDVLGGLQALAPDARAALLLRTVMGLSYREIAGALAIPEGTAMSHVHRARQSLRKHLEPDADRRDMPGARPRFSAAIEIERPGS